jgi:hypothetical protein
LQARITSAIQSGTGADIIHAMHNWPQLYVESLADVSDVADEIGGQQGGRFLSVRLKFTRLPNPRLAALGIVSPGREAVSTASSRPVRAFFAHRPRPRPTASRSTSRLA